MSADLTDIFAALVEREAREAFVNEARASGYGAKSWESANQWTWRRAALSRIRSARKAVEEDNR